MTHNHKFVQSVRREQERRGETQVAFARHLGVDQATLSKFYHRGVKDNLVIRVLRKYPHFAIYLASEEMSC